MNMKKTIAAVAASAMAVSAMATTLTASAVGPFTYSLLDGYTNTNGTCSYTITSSATGLTAKADNIKFVGGGSLYNVTKMTITLIEDGNNGTSKTYTYATSDSSLQYNKSLTSTGFTFDNEIESFMGGMTSNQYTMVVSLDVTSDASVINSNNAVNTRLSSGSIDIEVYDAGGNSLTTTPTILTALTPVDSTTYDVPFETNANNNQNITYFLQNKSVKTSYRNVLPVINDAIENSESVTFTFNTATSNIAFVPRKTVNGDTYYDFGDLKGSYDSAFYAGNGSAPLAIYSTADVATNYYTSFGQHIYGTTSNPYYDQTGWLGYGNGEDATWYGYADWTSQNLFGGALVVNENITMSLSDVDYFDWSNTSISFDWDAIRDNAYTSNPFAMYVQSLKLATSVRWYWDNMVIDVVEGAADDAFSSAPVENPNETLDDDDDDNGDITLDDGDDGEEPADWSEPDDYEEPASDTADVQDVKSPQTGNAPVALAVIPVALAAAAIVAKKRS